MRKALFVLFLLLFLGVSERLTAQVWTPPAPPQIDMQNQIWRTFRMGQIGNQMAADMARSRARGNRPSTAKKPVPVNPVTAKSSVYQKQFSFQRTAKSPLAEKMAGMKGGSSAADMQKLVDYMWGKYRTTMADENRRLGMPFEDVAAALTYYIVGSYMYANGILSLRSENSVAVYKQVAAILLKDPEFTKLQNADKQLLSELLVTMAGMPAVVYEQNHNTSEQAAAGKENLERIFGSEARKLRITENGMEF